MKFYIYWVLTVLLAIWAELVKLLPQTNGNVVLYWILITASVFFWVITYGSWAEEKNKDNPF